jgi:5-methyltetrahydrofolate--homocysteine methyltransferase
MNLTEFLATTTPPVLLDGAMGTQLALAGLEMGGQNCVSHPDEVVAVHKRYCAAGCDLLITNTLTMNRIYVETHHLNVDLKEVNLAGARLAKSAAARGQYVLGDISSTGQLLEPYGAYTETQCYDAFKEQAEFLLAGGVDGFIVETMLDLREAVCAVRACRDVSALPVVATLSFNITGNGGRTIMGNTARESAVALAQAGAAAVGANCGDLDPHEIAIIVGFMKEAVPIPIVAQPNAGKPRLMDNQTVFGLTPGDFAAGVQACIAAGASLVGGCCGTSPEHIRSVAKAIGKI